jgi:hypothetical protein
MFQRLTVLALLPNLLSATLLYRFAHRVGSAVRKGGWGLADNCFQQRVAQWLAACFPPDVCADRQERTYRFLEEALELAQASGCSSEDAHRLVRYVFSRPVGRSELEVGGVMVTLASLCAVLGIDMNHAADRELGRNWARIDAIRRKQATKPVGSPLPQ